jgi:hypothetical protein
MCKNYILLAVSTVTPQKYKVPATSIWKKKCEKPIYKCTRNIYKTGTKCNNAIKPLKM